MDDERLIPDWARFYPKIVASGSEISGFVNETPIERNIRMIQQEAGRDIRKDRLAYRHGYRDANRSAILIATEPCRFRRPIPEIEHLNGYRKELLARICKDQVVR